MAAKVRELLKTSRLTCPKVEAEKGSCFKSGVMKKPSRKECEKMRRDRLNNFIGELAEMVPLVKHAKKRLNKTGILRLTVNYLRLHQDLQKKNHLACKSWRPAYIESNFPIDFLESNNSFLFVYNKKGILTYISENVSSLLGQNQIDLLGQSILTIVHKDYQDVFLEQLKGPKETTSFNCKMVCSCLNSPLVHHECVQVTGHVRRAGEQDIAGGFLGAVRDVYCVAVGKVMSKAVIHNFYPANSSPLDFSNSLQYVSRHYLDGSVENMDQRASIIMGYMTKDMEGGSPYLSIHPNDLVFVARAHQRVFGENVIQSTVYRYMTCENKFLHIESQTHLIDDHFTRKPKFILSFNHVISSLRGRQLIRKQREDLIKERKAKKRSRICAGEVSDEVDKNNEGALVQLVYDENVVSISVPFNDFKRKEMQCDDLLIADDLVIADLVKEDGTCTGCDSVAITASSDSNNSGLRQMPGSSKCDILSSTFGEQCSSDITGQSAGISARSSFNAIGEELSPSTSHFGENFQESQSADVTTSESIMENFYENLDNFLEDMTDMSSFSVGPSECSDTQFSPCSIDGIDSTQQVMTSPGQGASTFSSHQTLLPNMIEPRCGEVGDVHRLPCTSSCNLKATLPDIPKSLTAVPCGTASVTQPLTCSTRASPSHCDSTTDQSYLDGPNQLNRPLSNYSHSVLRSLLEVCDREQPSSNNETS